MCLTERASAKERGRRVVQLKAAVRQGPRQISDQLWRCSTSSETHMRREEGSCDLINTLTAGVSPSSAVPRLHQTLTELLRLHTWTENPSALSFHQFPLPNVCLRTCDALLHTMQRANHIHVSVCIFLCVNESLKPYLFTEWRVY